MGFSSFRCAKSNESIPASGLEPCEITLFLKNGTKASGVYDGYGSIGQHHEIVQSVLFEVDGYDARLIRGTEEPQSLTSKFSTYTFDVDLIDPKGNLHEMQDCCTAEKGRDVAELFDQVKSRVIKSLAFDLNKQSLKIVKNKYVEDSDSFESLKASPHCRYQGFFYPDDYDWNVPDQLQKDSPDYIESEDLDEQESTSPRI